VQVPVDVEALLVGRNFAHVATLLPDGSPHSVPVWIGVEDGHVVFFTQEGSRKARNVERDPRVAISVVDHERPYLSAYLRGRVVGKREGEAALEVMDRLARRYTGEDFPVRRGVLYEVEVDRAGTIELPFEHR
jgi:PPOX class probable F420-dependent enzyme